MSGINHKALAVAGAAVAGAWLLERYNSDHPEPSTDIEPTREAGLDSGLSAAASTMPCGLERFSDVTHNGHVIQQLPSGAGTDFLREFHIQRLSLARTQGGLGGPAEIVTALLDTRRPALSSLCARQWIEIWLDAWQAAASSSPQAFRIAQPGSALLGSYDAGDVCDSTPSWRSEYSLNQWGGCSYTALGKAWARLRELHVAAAAATAPAIPESVQTARPWILARATGYAIQDFALELDRVSLKYGDAAAEALAELRKDLAPVNFLRKAADVAMVPIEVALEGVVGPALSSFLGTVVVAVLPYAALGAAIYLVVKRSA